MLRALQDPSYSAAIVTILPGEDFQHGLHVFIVGCLIRSVVVVPPARAVTQPLEVVGGVVRPHEFQFLVDVIRVHGMHGREQRHHLPHGVPLSGTASIARVDAPYGNTLSRSRYGFIGLPQGKGAKARIRGHEI